MLSLEPPASSVLAKNLSLAEKGRAKCASLVPHPGCRHGERYTTGSSSYKKKKKKRGFKKFFISKNSTEMDYTGNNKIYISSIVFLFGGRT